MSKMGEDIWCVYMMNVNKYKSDACIVNNLKLSRASFVKVNEYNERIVEIRVISIGDNNALIHWLQQCRNICW